MVGAVERQVADHIRFDADVATVPVQSPPSRLHWLSYPAIELDRSFAAGHVTTVGADRR